MWGTNTMMSLGLLEAPVPYSQSHNCNKKPKPFVLTPRDEKGFSFECDNQSRFDRYGFRHESNPKNRFEWKRKRGKGVDHIIYCLRYTISVEDKFLEDTPIVYPSHVKRDYIPRFKDTYDFRVVLTNDKKRFDMGSLELLELHHIKLMNPVDLVGFYYRLYYSQFKGVSYYEYGIRNLCVSSSNSSYTSCLTGKVGSFQTVLADFSLFCGG